MPVSAEDFATPHPEATWALERKPSGRRWLVAVLIIVLAVIGYAAYALFGPDTDQSASEEQPASLSSTGTIGAHPEQQSPPQNGSTSPAAPSAGAASRAVPHFGSFAEGLAAARASLASNDLSGARAALNAALAMQPDSDDAQALAREVAPREAQRDAALRAAQACAKNGQWQCAQQSASNALAADSGSDAAKALLEQAIVATGWASPASGAAASSHLPAVAAPASAAIAAHPQSDAAPSIEAQERAIRESGWSHPATQAATPPASAAASQ